MEGALSLQLELNWGKIKEKGDRSLKFPFLTEESILPHPRYEIINLTS